MWNIIEGFDTLITDYEYNSQDQITNLLYNQQKSDRMYFEYTYDYTGRLENVNYSSGIPSESEPEYINFCSYDYNANSQIEDQTYKSNTFGNTYSYNNRNWISEMTNTDSTFEYQNTYFKNGNVKTQAVSGKYTEAFENITSPVVPEDLDFTYTYDASNRLLTASTSFVNDAYDLVNTYDYDGNLTTLTRKNDSGIVTDNFAYKYVTGKNQLTGVSGKNQYSYDGNGNMTKDDLNQNSNIKYDYRNLIIQLKQKVLGD
ncbi:MAG: hypothetical protein ABI462_05105, partial [Ignavibacteria bacterium]